MIHPLDVVGCVSLSEHNSFLWLMSYVFKNTNELNTDTTVTGVVVNQTRLVRYDTLLIYIFSFQIKVILIKLEFLDI